MTEVWEVKSEILFPLRQISIGKNNEPPEKMEFASRYMANTIIRTDDITIYFEKWVESNKSCTKHAFGWFYESVALICQISCDDGKRALELSIPHVEWACDSLSYLAQAPILVESNQIYKVSDKSRKQIFPMPRQSAKFQKSHYMNVNTPPNIPLMRKPDHFTERDLAVLRWYHKSLAAQYDVDRFIFLWVCLEILCKISGLSVTAPYVANCNHEIGKCPQCGKSTEREVNGKTLQQYLSNELNVSLEKAKAMWQFRQMLHGQNKLTNESTKEMVSLIMELQAAVNIGIKRRLRFSEDGPPFVFPIGPSMSAMGIEITTATSNKNGHAESTQG